MSNVTDTIPSNPRPAVRSTRFRRAQNPRHGVSGPLSLDSPAPEELTETDKLIETLRSFNVFEESDEAEARKTVLSKLEYLLQKFVYNAYRNTGCSEEEASSAGGKIFTFGSYALGAHFAGADIDVLCLVPGQVSKENFFVDFQSMLKDVPEVEWLTSVAHAHVPVLKLKLSGIHIDLVYASLSQDKIDDDFDLDNYELLSELEDTVLRSLNGPRVSRDILSLIPSVPVFQTALRFIKLWAKRRGLYSNVLGYFGGVAYAIMVARICQLFPNAVPSTIIVQFFIIYSQWQWPYPVILQSIDTRASKVPVWNPTSSAIDQGHRMPVITPAFPSMCSTHNVTKMNHGIIASELSRGAFWVNKILYEKASWDSLLDETNFFQNHKFFIQVVVSSKVATTQLEWAGNVESKLRSLSAALELLDGIVVIHANPQHFVSKHYCPDQDIVRRVQDGELKAAPKPKVDDKEVLHVTCFYFGIIPTVKGTDPLKAPELEPMLTDFEDRLLNSEEALNSVYVKINAIGPESLPENVFAPFSLY